MKVPPKRKGNRGTTAWQYGNLCLNESPSEKEGKSQGLPFAKPYRLRSLNESPSEKEGK